MSSLFTSVEMLKKDFHNCPSTFEVCYLKIGFGKIIEVVTVLLFDHLFSTSEGERRFAAEDQRLPGGGQGGNSIDIDQMIAPKLPEN